MACLCAVHPGGNYQHHTNAGRKKLAFLARGIPVPDLCNFRILHRLCSPDTISEPISAFSRNSLCDIVSSYCDVLLVAFMALEPPALGSIYSVIYHCHGLEYQVPLTTIAGKAVRDLSNTAHLSIHPSRVDFLIILDPKVN